MNTKRLILGLSLAVLGLAAAGAGENLEARQLEDDLLINPCGTRDMTQSERELDQLRMNSLFVQNADELHSLRDRRLIAPSCEELCKQCIEIDVYFHLAGYRLSGSNTSGPWVIPHPRDEFELFRQELQNRTDPKVYPEPEPGRLSTVDDIYPLIQANMDVLNEHYKDTPFKFNWVNTDPNQANVGIQNDWAFFFIGNIHKNNGFATAYHHPGTDRRTLNVYLVYRICEHHFVWVESNCRTIGAATNPSYQLDKTADGVYLSYDTLTGGGLEHYSNGISLVHEVGHWLGLLHVFQSETFPIPGQDGGEDSDPCDPINAVHGDYVDDTPFLPQASVLMYRCSRTYYEAEGEEIPNSCPDLPGVDPVFNIMNYVGDEDCMNDGHARITCGQVERMYKQWLLYRDHNDECAPGEMMLSLDMQLDDNTVNAEIAPLNSNEEQAPVLDLQRDMDLMLFPIHTLNDARSIHLCVPEGEYVLGVTEQGREGFENGFMELSVNGDKVHRVEGNFGSTTCLKFNANGAATAELRNGVESVGAEFGPAYHYDVSDKDTTITCKASPDSFYLEPVPIARQHFMRVLVELAHPTSGLCINEVSKLEIGLDDFTATVYPNDPSFFSSKVEGCRGNDCIVGFDMAPLEDIYSSKNRLGLYNTTCTATVKVGSGEACDQYLKEGGIDCTPSSQTEFFATGQGQVLFSLPVSSFAVRQQFAVGLLVAIAGSILVVLQQ